MSLDAILQRLHALADPEAVAGMARYGINTQHALGISITKLRPIAKEIGRNHALAEGLWASGIHEARILAGIVDDPKEVTAAQLERWVADFDSWDLCDQCCSNLFARTPFAYQMVFEWSERQEEFVKRAAFALMAALSVHDKKAEDDEFIQFLPIIRREATDERNYVKKAVNWALRNIGKRNLYLNARAIEAAERIRESDSKAARWIAKDALRELTGEKVQARLKVKRARLQP